MKVAALRPSELDAAARPMELELVEAFRMAEAAIARTLSEAAREGWSVERLLDEVDAVFTRPVGNT